MSFLFYSFIFRLPNICKYWVSLSLFKQSYGFPNIFLIETAVDNYIRFGFSQLKFEKPRFPHFVVLKVGLFVEIFEGHKILFKLDCCILQSINFYLAIIFPNVFQAVLQTFQLIFKTSNCRKSCFCCNCIIDGALFKFKNWQQAFILKSNFNGKAPTFPSFLQRVKKEIYCSNRRAA